MRRLNHVEREGSAVILKLAQTPLSWSGGGYKLNFMRLPLASVVGRGELTGRRYGKNHNL